MNGLMRAVLECHERISIMQGFVETAMAPVKIVNYPIARMHPTGTATIGRPCQRVDNESVTVAHFSTPANFTARSKARRTWGHGA